MPTQGEATKPDLIELVEELLANGPPWTVETHNARGDYVRICLVRRGPQFINGYYVIAADDMETRREQTIKDFKDIVLGRELLRRLVEEVKRRDAGLVKIRDSTSDMWACAVAERILKGDSPEDALTYARKYDHA